MVWAVQESREECAEPCDFCPQGWSSAEWSRGVSLSCRLETSWAHQHGGGCEWDELSRDDVNAAVLLANGHFLGLHPPAMSAGWHGLGLQERRLGLPKRPRGYSVLASY